MEQELQESIEDFYAALDEMYDELVPEPVVVRMPVR